MSLFNRFGSVSLECVSVLLLRSKFSIDSYSCSLERAPVPLLKKLLRNFLSFGDLFSGVKILAMVFYFLTFLPRPSALLIVFDSFDSSDVKVPVPRLNSLSLGISIATFEKSSYFSGEGGEADDLVFGPNRT